MTPDDIDDARNRARRSQQNLAPQYQSMASNIANEANKLYMQAANQAARRAGQIGREEALREAIAKLAEQDVTGYTYSRKDGTEVRVSADVGIRRMINDEMRNTRIDQVVSLARRAGQDLVEVSSTPNARKSHAEWQGKVYSLTGATRGYKRFDIACHVGDLVDGIGGYNCGHTVSIYHGEKYSSFDDPLEGTGLNTEEAREIIATQRKLENELRKLKRAKEILQSEGYKATDINARMRTKIDQLNKLQATYPSIVRRQAYRENIFTRTRKMLDLIGKVESGTSEQKFINTAKAYEARKQAIVKVNTESKTYRKRARKAFSGELSDDQLIAIRRMLDHRSGTVYEDLYAFNMTTGDVIGSNTNSRIPYATEATPKMKRGIAEAVDASNDVVLCHNHPGSSIPSFADIDSVIKTHSAYGVVACHDGSFYTFRVVGSPAPGYTLSERDWSLFLALRTSDEEAKLLRDIERAFGVQIEHHT